MKKYFILIFLSVLCGMATAQERGGCNSDYTLPSLNFGASRDTSVLKSLRDIQEQWYDPDRIYEQIVLLVDYPDMQFSMENPREFYDRLFNEDGFEYADGLGKGSVAEYFRDQSNGRFNLHFNVYGPIRVNHSYSNLNYGEETFFDATQKAIDSLNVDFTIMNWQITMSNRLEPSIREIVFVSAGPGAVGGGDGDTLEINKLLWPSTGKLAVVSKLDAGNGLKISFYTASSEKWATGRFAGIGTICHEYCHTLGLPDIYPVNLFQLTTVDEWDLMDGGNYTACGAWLPNLTASEKYLLGWLKPVEITGPTKICDLKPLQDGGKAYIMKVSKNEFYTLENRNRQGKWDKGIPGEGLVITYTNFDNKKWIANQVNSSLPFLYTIVPADGWGCGQWEDYMEQNNVPRYVDEQNKMYSNYFRNAAFPFVNDTIEVRECHTLPFPIFNIQMADDGTISFEVGERQTAISTVENNNETENLNWYDLQGHRLPGMPTKSGVYIYGNRAVFINIKR